MNKLMNAVFVITAVLACMTFANAQVPVQTMPVKVGVVNTELFSDPKVGITRLVNALRSVETEFKPRRDEIAALVTRFETAQKVLSGSTREQIAAKREEAETLKLQIQRKQEDARVAYTKRLSALTDQIRLSIFAALEAFAKQRGIDLLVDLSKFPDGMFLVNRAADLTPAFIKDYNLKNP
jgi:Skp family chaperone for outer membrane proteins